jgi:ADP-glucose pyrophosphorylase
MTAADPCNAPAGEDRVVRNSEIARNTFGIVLAGGRGSRLMQLTDWRSKPAVPFGGKFRIIDFTLSNCVNSGIRRIGVATQYKAQSLIQHLQRGWSFLDGRFTSSSTSCRPSSRSAKTGTRAPPMPCSRTST